jgi:murein DD-endopeptidase MepM/ murein hydrolase activator NlpD
MTSLSMTSRLAVLAVVLLAVSACSRGGAPAPVSIYNEQPAPSVPGMVTVGRGDSVYDIARRYNVPMREVIELNRLTPPYALAIGQRLQLPTARFYTVQRGDTMYGISRMHQVGMSELARTNGLQEPYAIRVGQQLRLPGGGVPDVQVAENQKAALPPRPASTSTVPPVAGRPAIVAEALPEPPQTQATYPQNAAPAPRQDPSLPPYQPRRGYGMVQSGSMPAPVPAPAPTPVPPAASEMAQPPVEATRAPSVQPTPSVQAPAQPATRNQVAALPPQPVPAQAPSQAMSPAARPVPRVPTRPVPPAPAPQAAAAPSAAPVAIPAPVPNPHSPPPAASAPAPAAPAEVATAKPPAIEAPEPRAGSRFQWPVRGPILSDFGPKPGGLHNDGINISATRGASVVAADNGVVAYAGNELRGFGNLLLIRHADGWMTAYAHLDDMMVERGAKVTRGQKIGTVGSTGNVSSPQLHFEVRRGNRAIDPRDHLAGEKRVSRDVSPDGRPGPG